ncbi:hypothetical protein MCOR04_007896, partial [Pyricularia oryzae]
MAPYQDTMHGGFFYFTRAYSPLSSGRHGTVSGRLLSLTELQNYIKDEMVFDDFQRHADVSNREPTSLISTSSRITDTLARAFQKHILGEPADEVWIIFGRIPIDDYNRMRSQARIHNAMDVATRLHMETPKKFRYEYLFVSEIPTEFVQHKVSVRTLLDRGFPSELLGECATRNPTANLQRAMMQWFSYECGGLDVEELLVDYAAGRVLGSFVKHFGARAPGGFIER